MSRLAFALCRLDDQRLAARPLGRPGGDADVIFCVCSEGDESSITVRGSRLGLLAGRRGHADDHLGIEPGLAAGGERVHKSPTVGLLLIGVDDQEAQSAAEFVAGLRFDPQ